MWAAVGMMKYLLVSSRLDLDFRLKCFIINGVQDKKGQAQQQGSKWERGTRSRESAPVLKITVLFEIRFKEKDSRNEGRKNRVNVLHSKT